MILHFAELSDELLRLLDRDGHRLEEDPEPLGGAGHGGLPVDGTEIAISRQAFDVFARPRQEDEAHWKHRSLGQPATGQDGVDESASDASVAVRERMDGLELSVGQGGLQ
ncbi:hypothetical protein ACFY36_20735 [Actinoplanes sp. NPDC000266]